MPPTQGFAGATTVSASARSTRPWPPSCLAMGMSTAAGPPGAVKSAACSPKLMPKERSGYEQERER